jgi:hypothetical protein
MKSFQPELLPEPGPEVIECSGGELLALDAQLKTEGRRFIAIAEVAGISGWRVTIVHQPTTPKNEAYA